MIKVLSFLSLFLWMFLACTDLFPEDQSGSTGDPPPVLGELNNNCHPDQTCQEGLICEEGQCVEDVPVENQDAGHHFAVDGGSSTEPPPLDGGIEQETGLSCDANDECIYFDASSGLSWQGCSAGFSGTDCSIGEARVSGWEGAMVYCDDLSWGGHDDWMLPIIDELRSLIRGCPQNELGDDNTCSITHACSYSIDDNNTCDDEICDGCSTLPDGPGVGGCFRPADLFGPCTHVWAASLQSEDKAYSVSLTYGYIDFDNVENNFEVRCVRSQP